MNPSLKKHLDTVSEECGQIIINLTDLIKEKLSPVVANFFLRKKPGSDFLERIYKKLFNKAGSFVDRPTSFNLEFSSSEEVEEILAHKDEIKNFLKDEVGLEISQWYQNTVPMKNSTFVMMEYVE